MGFLDFLGKSFGKKVEAAIDSIDKMNIGVKDLRAVVTGKSVTLEGKADSLETKGRAVQEFNKLVVTENTFNKIEVVSAKAAASAKKTASAPASAPEAGDRIHVVVSGDTLSALAKKYYGKAGLYKKIFEANRDTLKNPDLIKVGQKLKIPK